jgi:hypothetical protein
MRTRSLVISGILTAALVLALAVIALAADPFVGTWKMNMAKSKTSFPLPKSITNTCTAQGSTQKITMDSVDADGTIAHRSWTSTFDGKDHPVVGDPNTDMSSETRINPNTIEYVNKKNGKEASRGRVVVSKDGKAFTDTGGGTDAKGRAFTYTIVMEKQ